MDINSKNAEYIQLEIPGLNLKKRENENKKVLNLKIKQNPNSEFKKCA